MLITYDSLFKAEISAYGLQIGSMAVLYGVFILYEVQRLPSILILRKKNRGFKALLILHFYYIMALFYV